MSRSLRRHHQQRADGHAREIAAGWGLPERWYRLRHNRRSCSCHLCSGYRLEPTRQDLRARARLEEGA